MLRGADLAPAPASLRRRYFHTLPFLLLRSPLPRWLAVAALAGIEVRVGLASRGKSAGDRGALTQLC